MRRRRVLGLALALAGCGVPGRPLPPPAPRAPTTRALRTPAGYALRADTESLIYLEGAPLPAARIAPGQALALPATTRTVRVVAVAEGRAGDPATVVLPPWRPPPAPIEPPVAFVDASGQVRLTWIPPAAGAESIVVLRDAAPIATLAANSLGHADAAPPGPHAYTLVAVGDDWRTGPSRPARVQVPPPR